MCVSLFSTNPLNPKPYILNPETPQPPGAHWMTDRAEAAVKISASDGATKEIPKGPLMGLGLRVKGLEFVVL